MIVPPAPSTPSRERLLRLVARLDARTERLRTRSLRLSRLRIAAVLTGGFGAWWLGNTVGARAGWTAALLTVLVFGLLARRHERIERAHRRTRLWRTLQARHLDRLHLRWAGLLPDHGTPAPHHPFAADLDVVGPQSLLTLLSTTGTCGGHERLRAWLLETSPGAHVVRERQAAVQKLVGLRRLRERLALLAHEAAATADARWDDAPLRAWMEAPGSTTRLRRWALALSSLAALTAVLFIAAPAGSRPYWLLSLLVYLTLYGYQWVRTSAVFETTYALEQTLRAAVPMLAWMERSAEQSAVEGSFWAPFRGTSRPGIHLARLRRLAGAASLTQSEVLRLVFNLILPYDLLFTLALSRLRLRLSALLPAWLDALYEFEALGALAAYADLNPSSTVFPDLLADGCTLEAEDLRHPLLPQSSAVGNSATFACGEVMVLTGSNMSGKSTFLRTLGLASVLAWSGGAVPAGRLLLSPFRPFTSMRIGDLLQEGLSTFYAEVRRLRQLLDAVEAGGSPSLVLIDEMLRGTNNRERLAGSRAIVSALAGADAVSLVATHDLALTHLSEESAQVRNAHFREDAVADRLVFDYTLREGPCPTTNALVIMQRAGLPVPTHAPPDEPPL